jgi:hypothetical protein
MRFKRHLASGKAGYFLEFANAVLGKAAQFGIFED